MFELYRQPGTLRSATPNNELHGENHVKVLYMYFVFQLSNDELPMFGSWMRAAFYKLADNPDLEQEAEQRPTALTLPNLKMPLKLDDEYTGVTTTFHWGIGEESWIILPECKLSKYSLTLMQGGTFETAFMCTAHPDEKQRGFLTGLVGEKVEVSFAQPAPQTAEDLFRKKAA